MFSSRCFTFEVPGIGSITGDFLSNHARATCAGWAPSCLAILVNAPSGFREVTGREREPRNEADVFARAVVQDVFGIAVREIVLILHGGDGNDATRCFDLGNIDFRKANMPDLAFLLEISQHSKLIVGWNLGIDAMQLEQIDTLDTQPSQAHLAFLPEIFGSAQWNPPAGTRPSKAGLCGDNKSFWVRMQCLANQFFTYIGSIGIRRVDEVYAELDRTA